MRSSAPYSLGPNPLQVDLGHYRRVALDMKGPVLVVTDEIDVFSSAEEAERYLEPWILEAPLRIYDYEGFPLVAGVSKTRILKNEVVVLTEATGAAARPDELRSALLEFLTVRGVALAEGGQVVALKRLWEMALPFKT